VQGGVGEDPRVDASGNLPDGRAFDGPTEFKRHLAQDEEGLAKAFLEHLATYALRRVITVDDRAALETIVEANKADGFRLRDLVAGLVTSPLFSRR